MGDIMWHMSDEVPSLILPDTSSWLIAAWKWLVNFLPVVGHFFKSFADFLVTISIPISFFFFIGIIYCVERLKKVRQKEALIHEAPVEPAFEEPTAANQELIRRWDAAKLNIESSNPNDWKQAIIDADIILDDLLNKLGYRGESVGEKLKRVNPGDMKSLNEAWEAHKIRNQIAHEPGYTLDEHIAKKAFHMYHKVFDEFYFM